MAQDKKSIIVYADWIDIFEELTDDEAGRLIKHFFRYVNDLDPEAPDRITKLLFTDIRNTLKRDLKKYESKRKERSANGRMGNLKRYNKDLYEMVNNNLLNLEEAENIAKTRKNSHSDKKPRIATKNLAKLAVSVSDSDSIIIIEEVYNKFLQECKEGKHNQILDSWYMSLKLKEGSLTHLIKDFKTQLLTDNTIHKNTLEFRKHFKRWLDKIDMIGKLNNYKK